MYNRYDPSHHMNRSPMNMASWYPPTTYSASPTFNNASSAASFRGGYSTTYNAQAGYGSSGITGSAPFVGFDPDMMAAMASLNMGGSGASNTGANSTTEKDSSSK